MKSVKIENHGTIHYHAYCESCDWSGNRRSDAKKHTRETGHPTFYETGNSTRFTLEDKK